MADDPLERYRSKRNFDVTPEPAGGGAPSAGALRFVVHKHWASHLHYDLRLELDGTMKSWAVPKGPSYDSADKRMAVQVEDHPMAYNTFEGNIPAGQYGAGKVIVWDQGTWEPLGNAQEGWRQGRLKFLLHGHKLQGRWTLVRMAPRRASTPQAPAWLWIKERDGLERSGADYSVVDARPESVASLGDAPLDAAPAPASAPAQRGQDRPAPQPPQPPHAPGGVPAPLSRAARSRRAKPAKNAESAESAGGPAVPVGTAPRAPARAGQGDLPLLLAPQLATLVDAPPARPQEWVFELKFDGYRLLARIEHGQVRLFTRSGKDWSARMPALVHALAQLPLASGWIDGEVLVLDAQGLPDFQALQNAFSGQGTLVYYVFDLPFADGQDLRALPLRQRRERLQQLLAQAPPAAAETVRFSQAFDAPAPDLVASACQLGFEGVIGKRGTAPYASERNTDWIKLKCSQRQEFVIGGYTDPQGTRTGLGSLLLGVHAPDGRLDYAGNVGTGFDARTLAALRERLQTLEAAHSPFGSLHPAPARRVHWVQPTLLAEVAFAGWTRGGRVRHAVFQGLREDKPAQAIAREVPLHLEASPPPARPPARAGRSAQAQHKGLLQGLRISHPERVIDAASGTTKLDWVRCCAAVAPLMLEHLRQRPVALVRAPEGVAGELFFQKHMDTRHLPGVAEIAAAVQPAHSELLEVLRVQGVLSAAQMNVVEFHTWNARKDRMDRPDRMAFDLDPGEGVGWTEVAEGAQLLQVLLAQLGLPAFLKTSGGKGLHVVVPLQRRHGWDVVKGFSQALVLHLAQTVPQRFVAKSGPRNRVGKIFVDYLRNGWGATTVCAWSARARPGMGVSVPLAWSELPALTGSAHWTVQTIAERLSVGNTPWSGYAGAAAALGAAMQALGYRP